MGGQLPNLPTQLLHPCVILCIFSRADSSTSEDGSETVLNNGLSEFGEMIVKEMNRLGMMVDISHVSSDTMRDALRHSTPN